MCGVAATSRQAQDHANTPSVENCPLRIADALLHPSHSSIIVA
jgi:hypothetical protein